MSRMTRSNPRPTSDEHPLTEYEKVRARNMMRNNRILQSLGIDAIASMIRKTNDVQQGTTNGVQEGSGVISDDPEYNPKEDEVVVLKTVKVQTLSWLEGSGSYAMTNKHRLRKGKGLERITKWLGTKVPIQIAQGMKRPEKPLQAAKFASECGLVARSHLSVLPHFKEYKNNATLVEDYIGEVDENFEINTDSETIKYACKDVLQKSSKNRRHNIKKKYFDTVAANKVSTKSPVPDLTDGWEWAMVPFFLFHVSDQSRNNREHQISKSTPYKEERKGEELSAIDLFKATHNSKKHGFLEPVKIAIVRRAVPEGEEPKSDAEIVEEVLKTEVNQSTFLRNVGLKSSSNNSGKGTAVVDAHVLYLQQKLERSELQAEVMQEEMAAMKLKAGEYEAARDKELELLRKKSQEQEEKLVHLMALFGAKAL
ncbi:hypothetical protein D1007_26007 [Hordeum vulgare]|nr:hypothetical protein D1007_26007 [Hordeum vulgare]